MKIALPNFGDTYDPAHMRELGRVLESAFFHAVEDRRRGAFTTAANYTLQHKDTLVLVAPVASATVTITVPAVAAWMVDQKFKWNVKLIAAGTLTVTPVSGTIEGTTSVSTSTVNTSMEIWATNDGWKIV